MAKTVLIVEDSKTQAQRAKLLLENAGYRVDLAEDGEMGLHKILVSPPDLVITDILMPKMDGYDMTWRLKCDPRTSKVPVMMLTNQTKPLDLVRGLESGADHFVTKPYTDEYLLERIAALFDSALEPIAMARERQQLHRFNHEVAAAGSREQLLQALLQCTSKVLGCEAMVLLLAGDYRQPLLFVLSVCSLQPRTVEMLRGDAIRTLGRLRSGSGSDRLGSPATIRVVTEVPGRALLRESDLLHSSLYSSLAVGRRIIGLIGAFSPRSRLFDPVQVKFLYLIGNRAADGLSRLATSSSVA